MKTKTSEWVSLGHPDKMADYITSYLLDEYLAVDKATRYAVEVMIKNEHVTLGGEISSEAKFTRRQIADFVRKAVEDIGYTAEYRRSGWDGEVVTAEMLKVERCISLQSPDIAQGVNEDTWGDQGIFWGMAVNNQSTHYMPEDWFYAKSLGQTLFSESLANRLGGLDIKTQISMEEERVTEVVIAIPLLNEEKKKEIEAICRKVLPGDKYQLHINGTGRYVRHGSCGDCGVTGRKLAVDLYGGNCRIGGGSLWGKDCTKADVSLNVAARYYALHYMLLNGLQEVHCAISCRIGSPEINIIYLDEHMEELKKETLNLPPSLLGKRFGLFEPHYKASCQVGVFQWVM